MTLEQWSFIAQIASATAVIASRIFVAIQLRRATSAIRATSSQAHSALYTDLVRSIIDSADFAQSWSIGLTDPKALSQQEWVRFVAYASALFRLYESSRVQWLNGRLDEEHWHTIERQAADFGHLPGLQLAGSCAPTGSRPNFARGSKGLIQHKNLSHTYAIECARRSTRPAPSSGFH